LNQTKGSDIGGQVSVVRHLTLTPTHRLHVIRVHGRELLLVTHPHGCENLNFDDDTRAAVELSEDGRVR
jgi:hypothetical protein